MCDVAPVSRNHSPPWAWFVGMPWSAENSPGGTCGVVASGDAGAAPSAVRACGGGVPRCMSRTPGTPGRYALSGQAWTTPVHGL